MPQKTDVIKLVKKQHKGVYHNTSHDTYFAYVSINGKRYSKNFNIKSYVTREEAYRAACEWQEKMTNELHGEFSVYKSRA